MAKFKCSDGVYTVLRNGKSIANNQSAGQAISAISADAVEVACCSIEVTAMTPVDGGVSFDVTATGTHLNMSYNYNDGEATGTVGCTANEGTIFVGDAGMYIPNTDPLVLTFYSSVDGCLSYCAEYAVSKYSRNTTVLTSGAATVAAVPAGTPACMGVTIYEEVFTTLVGATLNAATGDVTIPAQILAETAYYIYVKYCDGLLTGILVIEVTNP